MERISAPVGGYKVEAYTARNDAGWTGVARVVRKPAGESPADVVVERLNTSPLSSEQQALRLAEEKAQQAVLRRLLQGGA